MSLAIGARILGTHAFFYNEGDTITVAGAPSTTGPATRTNKPGATDPLWVDLGVIEDSSDNLADTEIEVYSPSPGRLRLYDAIPTKDKLMIKFTTSELSALVIQTLYRTLKLTSASTQYNHLEGKQVRGWLKVQRYDQADVAVNVFDVFCRMKISGDVAMGADLAKAQFEALVLHSTLNTGTL